MKILFAHSVYAEGLEKWYAEIAATAEEGLEVICFPITLSPPGPRLSWKELNWRWQRKEKRLMEMYRRLQEVADDCDVFFLYNGANIHPEFLQYLPTFNVYCCFDDPESSKDLSEPVAAAFDAVFFGNIAARFQYEHWGCKKLAWLPIFTAPSDIPSFIEGQKLLSSTRDVDILLVCEKNLMRSRRLDMLTAAFPQAKCYGSGWMSGKISNADLKSLFTRTKLGWNIHNSTGPVNRRMFMLTGFGVLQICDNKFGLGHIFELDKEAVGFNTISEAIEITRYYLNNEENRREIAARGWRRFWQDYHASAIWSRINNQLVDWMSEDITLHKKKIDSLPSWTPLSFAKPYVSIIKDRGMNTLQQFKILTDVWFSRKSSAAIFDDSVYRGESIPAYIENPAMHGVNMARERLAKGEPFEWPNMLALNWAATSLIRDAKKIVEIGSGTGPFAHFASVARDRTIHCFEEDDFARSWAEKNRSHSNVAYFKKYEVNSETECYDLLVSLDVIEHVADMHSFLSFCSRLAPRAIFSTPNRDIVRSVTNMGPPSYPPHVREFDAGEFYWILRQYYPDVVLYYMPDCYVPWLAHMTIRTKGTPIIAECKKIERK